MANVDRPRGARPVKHMNGNPYNGEFNVYFIPSTDNSPLFVGDFVKHAGGGDATGKYPTVDIAVVGTGNPILGVIIGFGDNPAIMANVTDLNVRYRLASVDKYVAVVDDPSVIFEIQEVSAGTALTAAAIGNNVPFVAGSGNTATGVSGHEMNNAGEVNTTEQLRILRLQSHIDNALGEHAKWLVMINEHFYKEAAGV